MAVSQSLKSLAKKIAEEADSVIAEAEYSPAMVEFVLERVASTVLDLETAGKELEKVETSLTPELMETIAGLAQALDETGDEELVKRASMLDELLVTISAPKNAIAQAAAKTEDEINKLRAEYRTKAREALYVGRSKSLAQQENREAVSKAVKEQVRTYRPMEAPLTTRYCPDHPGVSVLRIADRVYQCPLDHKIYNYEAGFTTEKGNQIPGGGVENQIPDWGFRDTGHTTFDSRDSLMRRYTSAQEQGMVKLAQGIPHHTVSMDHNTKQFVVTVPAGTTDDQKKQIEQNIVGTYGTLYPIIFKGASLKKKFANVLVPVPFSLTEDEYDDLMILANVSDYESIKRLYIGYDPQSGTMNMDDAIQSYFATKYEGEGAGNVPMLKGTLLQKVRRLFEDLDPEIYEDDIEGTDAPNYPAEIPEPPELPVIPDDDDDDIE